MRSLTEILTTAQEGRIPDRLELAHLLDLQDPADRQALFDAAYAVKEKNLGKVVYFRGLIEISNLCAKDCLYCGIRKSNTGVQRFRLDEEQIVSAARWAHASGYGSVVMQGGEVRGLPFTRFIEHLLQRIHQETGGELAITLSLGEQDRDTYARWREAGAHRYLLRLETSSRELYASLHPADHDWEERLHCLHLLRETGYQVGTGIMCGLPGQSVQQIADDLLFIHELDVDMVGMGPYIPHLDTPLAVELEHFDKAQALERGLAMVACMRLLLPDANMASTTALQALAGNGRERGLLAGANIIMPNVTDTSYRSSYQLYDGKPGLDENSEQSRLGLERCIAGLGETIGYGLAGTSPRYAKRDLAP